ncbi:hypothetical protein [Methanosarcina sp. UBA5]|uniref:hypothetical protein n=1 Tax=Methanosarcina sp. UBA5 TaxID=1915593 RepID=UPI0025DF1FDF|nr:hypothetical protein [Methanosarcina sp. UBA5]
MLHIKSISKFVIGFSILHSITYFFAGIIAQKVLGASEFYPPSLYALSYLRDPLSTHVQMLFMPAQLIRGMLFAGVLLPFRKRIFELGQVWGGLLITAIVFVFGYLAASGGLIEHYVYFTAESYPLKFALITLIEILIQTLLLGQLVMLWERRFNGDYYK